MGIRWVVVVLVAVLLLPAGSNLARAGEPDPAQGEWLLDDPVPMDGDVLPPSSPGSPPAAAASGPGSVSSAGPTLAFGFNVVEYPLRDLPAGERPYYSATVMPIVDSGDHDAAGVRMFRIGTTLYNHPVAQARYGLQLLNSWVATGDQRYFDRAVAQAQRLTDTKVVARGAWYFPYPFDYALHGNPNDVLRAPWYSAMAQGEALALFVWLNEITGTAAYRTAADMTFNSFLNPRASGTPWTVFVDGSGYLWFEEYAHDAPDRTFNGHNFSLFGVQYYYALTGSADAARLLRGGLTTTEHYASVIRSPYGASRYCVSHDVHDNYYHLVNSEQLRTDYRITGAPVFALLGDRLVDDLPDYRSPGTLTLAAGDHTGYAFDSQGKVTAKKTVHYATSTALPYTQRRTTKGSFQVYFLVGAGALDGYWLPELPGRAYVPGRLKQAPGYVPPLPVVVRRGPHTGLQFDANGSVTNRISAAAGSDQQLHVAERAVINGSSYRLVVDGSWAGSYLPYDETTGAPTIRRLAGPDRYATAAAITASRFPATTETVYVATGEGFADALAIGPVAGAAAAPILLVAHDRIPAPTDAELRRLAPVDIVVLGGPPTISDAVVTQLRAYASGSVTRRAGIDRYATAAAVSAAAFAPGLPVAYLVSGLNFPDALATVPLAAANGAPILLTMRDRLPAATAAELARLRPGRIVIVGGPEVVSGSVASQLATYATGGVARIAGSNRYETAALVSQALTQGAIPAEGFVATGLGFADALAIGPVAGAGLSPVLLTDPSTLSVGTAAELRRLGLGTLTVIGGTPSVSGAVTNGVTRLWR